MVIGDVLVIVVGVIAFGLDNAGSLAQTYGQKTLATITKRLGKILLVKLGANDSIHSDETGRCFIVSPGTSHARTAARGGFFKSITGGIIMLGLVAIVFILFGGDIAKVFTGASSTPAATSTSAPAPKAVK